ncbi:ARM repeat superfamily protein [Tasmannia lanceolata]|uniref:ARM repeat superfamily protein n=1 Tax=Tasmannia lanceolata TaxID=3420 RepID=UPI004062CDDF
MMEKNLRSSLQISAEEFLLSATKIDPKSGKSTLKTLIFNITPSSNLSTSLPSALHISISKSIDSFKQPNLSNDTSKSPNSPPTKRLRKSSRNRKKIEDSKDGEGSNPKIHDSKRQVLLKNLQIYTFIMHLCISHPKKPFSPINLLPSVQALHDTLILYESDQILQSDIAGLCEEWWKDQLPERETLISQSLPFLLSKSLTLRKKVDVHRVYALREALCLFDFNDDSIEDLKLLLVRCVITPLYLKTEEGRKFLAFLFGLNLQLVKEALAMIRSQIPFGRKGMLEAYADVLFRAWKVAEGSLRDEIEKEFLQSLIEGAIHGSSSSLAASIRRVLGGFINQRTTNGVEKLLFRLAEPVLFRSLQVANSNVRQNALHLLLDMFPLEDPDATKDIKDALLNRQFFLLERLLADECPDVRVVAVEGSCRILRLFWEVIPSSTITKILTKVVDDMSHDLCNVVRLSTLNGIIYLLDNPQTHEILKVLLPRLQHMLLDTVLSVRVAVTDLLLAIRDIRSFQFNKVVGLDALLSSLASDHPLVAQKITRLLIPSYFPSKVTLKEACSRCVALIRRSPIAGARFCEFAISEGSSLNSHVELVRVFIGLALSPSGLNPDQIDGFIIAAVNLCQSMLSEISCKETLNELFSGEKLKCMFTAASTVRARTSILSVASIISQDNVSELLEQCMGLILKCGGLSENVEGQEEVRAAHKLMMSYGRFDDLFEALTNLLQMASSRLHIKFGSEMPKQDVLRRKKKKVKLPVKTSKKLNHVGKRLLNSGMANAEDDYVLAAAAAWQIKDLLKYEDTRNAVLNSPVLELAFYSLKAISWVTIQQCWHWESLDTSPVLAYTALSLHTCLENIDITDLSDEKSNDLHSTGPSLGQTALDHSLNYLLNCTKKLLCASDPGKSGHSTSELKQGEIKMAARRRSRRREGLEDIPNTTDGGTEIKPDIPELKRISNIVKMVTTVLKFVVDATSVGLVHDNQARALQFTSAFMHYIISALEKKEDYNSLSNEGDFKETFMCLKSSISYAAKLLNLVLTDLSDSLPPPAEISYLANDILNLVASIESHLGSRHAGYLVAVLKPWLPDLILALGSSHVWIKATQESGSPSLPYNSKLDIPAWLVVLSMTEVCELSELRHDEQTENDLVTEVLSVFKKLMEMVVLYLKKGKPIILDAFGFILLSGATFGMEREDFGLVLALVHFVCEKLMGCDYEHCEELEMILSSLQEIYLQVEQSTKDPEISEDGRQKLECVKRLLESVGMVDM